jgi:hypothetical protein
MAKNARVYFPGRPFQRSVMFESKARNLLKWCTFHGLPLRSALVLLANITLGWEDLPGTNTLTYFAHSFFVQLGFSLE